MNKIICIVAYINLLATTLYFYGDYPKNLLILQFTNNRVVRGTITNIETKRVINPKFFTVTFKYYHYTFTYKGKQYDDTIQRDAIIHFVYTYINNIYYRAGYPVQILYNVDNNFFYLRDDLPYQIFNSIALLFLLPIAPIIILLCVKIVIDRKRFEKKYGKYLYTIYQNKDNVETFYETSNTITSNNFQINISTTNKEQKP